MALKVSSRESVKDCQGMFHNRLKEISGIRSILGNVDLAELPLWKVTHVCKRNKILWDITLCIPGRFITSMSLSEIL